MTTHRERVKKVQKFAGSNKVFTIFAVIIVLFLLSNFIFSMVKPEEQEPNTTSQSELSNKPEPTEQTSDEVPHWRFYWIDLWILVGAGGLCSVMIIRQRKKAREELK